MGRNEESRNGVCESDGLIRYEYAKDGVDRTSWTFAGVLVWMHMTHLSTNRFENWSLFEDGEQSLVLWWSTKRLWWFHTISNETISVEHNVAAGELVEK